MTEYVVDMSSVDSYRCFNWANERITRCRNCKWLGRETVVAGEYRCERTDRVTCLEDFCSRAVAR